MHKAEPKRVVGVQCSQTFFPLKEGIYIYFIVFCESLLSSLSNTYIFFLQDAIIKLIILWDAVITLIIDAKQLHMPD